jgi:hypothetical protein
MKIFFTVTIDVEPDASQNWHYTNPISFVGVKKGIGEILHPLFKKYGVIPTYLINNVVLEDDESIDVFKSLKGNLELAAHLHPEFIGPQKEVFDYSGAIGEALCCGYEPEIEYEKIKSITNLFTDKFNVKPTSFRAGRFSVSADTLNSLHKLGYKVDTSITPNVNWKFSKNGKALLDFTKSPNQPYFVKPNTMVAETSKEGILEVPVSIVSMINFSRLNFLKPVWLRPTYSSLKEMIAVYEQLVKDNKNAPYLVLNMMFHNVEIVPGINPYTHNQEQANAFLYKLEQFFSFCNKNQIEMIRLSDLHDVYRT